jgi:hypothetical protein
MRTKVSLYLPIKKKGVNYQYGYEMYLNTTLITFPVSEMRFMLCRLLLSLFVTR